MKILVAHDYYLQSGGEDQVVADETAMLEAHGHEVVRFAVHNSEIERMGRLKLAQATVWNGSVQAELGRVLRNERPDVAHFHNTFPLISPAAYYACRAEGVAVVQTLHNYRLMCPNGLFLSGGKVCEDCLGMAVPWPGMLRGCYRGSRLATGGVAAMLAMHRAARTWSRCVDVYIALGEFGRRKFIEGGLPGERIVVKPHFVARDPGVGRGNGDYAVFVGRLSQEKGVELLLDAWREVRESIGLRIIGDGPLADRVQAATREDARITWLGARPNGDVLEEMKRARFSVVPSLCYETFGRTVVEAFACGTPVIAADHGAIAELVRDGRTGLLFRAGSVAGLMRAIKRLMGGEMDVAEMRRQARTDWERSYRAETNYGILMDAYRRAMVGRAQTREAQRAAA